MHVHKQTTPTKPPPPVMEYMVRTVITMAAGHRRLHPGTARRRATVAVLKRHGIHRSATVDSTSHRINAPDR